VACLLLGVACGSYLIGQTPQAGKVERGSQTAKAGFKNEDDIRDKFNNWREDADARAWLAAMGYKLADIESVRAAKPHGEKADVVVRIRVNTKRSPAETQRRGEEPEEKTGIPHSRKAAKEIEHDSTSTTPSAPTKGLGTVTPSKPSGEFVEGISIKLVSSPTGFNQIDKRWLANYAKKWNMPTDVVAALKLYLGELPPNKPSRDRRRMFLNELEPAQQTAVIDFFAANKELIVSDMIEGDGAYAAGWMMVAFKATDKPRWVIKSSREAVRLFAEGKVEMTRAGNLKIGRITMQRKGGDGGRETAKMLQFKINPALLFI
jgi:hypothetical protein